MRLKSSQLPRRPLLLGAAASLAAAPAPTAISVRVVNGTCLVPVTLDDRQASLVLDTGAERTIVTQQAAARLRLRRDPWIGTTLRGAGGLLERYANAVIGHAEAGGALLFQRTPGAGLSLPVTGADLGEADGLLGGDVLRHFTVALDVPSGRLLLLAAPVQGAVGLTPLRDTLLLAPVTLDGHALTALLDTGAAASLVNARGAHRLGLDRTRRADDAPAVLSGIGGQSPARVRVFTRLRIGPLVLTAPRLLVADVPEGAYDMTLGLDVLGRQPSVISYANASLAIGAG